MTRLLQASLCAPLLLAGCVSARPSVSQIEVPQEVIASEVRFRKEYIWSPGDQLEVVVRDVPEVSRIVVVRPDGFISLPRINDVKTAGFTPMELMDTLTKKFAERMVNPEVSVIAVQVRPPMVYVLGEVTNNAGLPLRNASTAAQAIALAGGLRKSARASRAVIIRLGEDGKLRAIPLQGPVGGQPGPFFGLRTTLLEADDIVFVPESGRSQVVRFLDEMVNRPLQTLTGSIGVYFQFRLIELIAQR